LAEIVDGFNFFENLYYFVFICLHTVQFILNIFVKFFVENLDYISVLLDLLWSFCHKDFCSADGLTLSKDVPVVIAVKNLNTRVTIITGIKIVNASSNTEYSFVVVCCKFKSNGVFELNVDEVGRSQIKNTLGA